MVEFLIYCMLRMGVAKEKFKRMIFTELQNVCLKNFLQHFKLIFRQKIMQNNVLVMNGRTLSGFSLFDTVW